MCINPIILNIKLNCSTHICIYSGRYRATPAHHHHYHRILRKVLAEPSRQGRSMLCLWRAEGVWSPDSVMSKAGVCSASGGTRK